MKNLTKIRTAVVLFATLFLGFTSCNDDDVVTPVIPPTVVDNTIAAKAIATPSLSILVAALQKTNLVATLQGNGPFTVFAPTDAAFGALSTPITVASINASTPAQVAALKEILLNHVVAGSNSAAQLSNNQYLTTSGKGLASATNNLRMLVNKTTVGAVTTVKLNNNATVSTADINASNGVIHIVDKVITAPTIVDLVATNTNFSTLVGSLTTPLVTTLSGPGPLTVFAPNNAAFTAVLAELAPTVPNTTQLTNVITYHVVSGNFLASNLPAVVAAGPTATVNGQSFTIGLTPVPQITGTYAPARSASKIIATDIQANNGVIHVLDKVLLPATF